MLWQAQSMDHAAGLSPCPGHGPGHGNVDDTIPQVQGLAP
jgi:hypothetical protein